MRFVPGLLPILATMVAWLASKFCKPQKWSKKLANGVNGMSDIEGKATRVGATERGRNAVRSRWSLITDHESLIAIHFLPGSVSQLPVTPKRAKADQPSTIDFCRHRSLITNH